MDNNGPEGLMNANSMLAPPQLFRVEAGASHGFNLGNNNYMHMPMHADLQADLAGPMAYVRGAATHTGVAVPILQVSTNLVFALC